MPLTKKIVVSFLYGNSVEYAKGSNSFVRGHKMAAVASGENQEWLDKFIY